MEGGGETYGNCHKDIELKENVTLLFPGTIFLTPFKQHIKTD